MRRGARVGFVSAPLVLVAASGLAREVAEAARRAGRDVIGCVDDDFGLHGTEVAPGLVVLGGVDVIDGHPDAELVLCAGRGTARGVLAGRLTVSGHGRWATVVDPSAVVPPSCSVGEGSVLLAGVVLTADVAVGSHVVCMPHVTLTHDDVLEDHVTLAAGVALGGGVTVEDGAYLGMRSSVREALRIGARAVLGMGAVLLEDLPAGETWAGVPAGPIQP